MIRLYVCEITLKELLLDIKTLNYQVNDSFDHVSGTRRKSLNVSYCLCTCVHYVRFCYDVSEVKYQREVETYG